MPLHRKNGALFIDEMALTDVAEDFGTPLFVYSWSEIQSRFQTMQDAANGVNGHIYYAVKANSNLSILDRLASMGAGFDIVSAGELLRVIEVGGDPTNVVFSGVGKSKSEISLALKYGIKAFSVESEPEFHRIQSIAQNLGIVANIVLRLNPDIPIESHPYITTGLKENKFGLTSAQVKRLYLTHFDDPWLNFRGLSSHLGSQIGNNDPYLSSLSSTLKIRNELISAGPSVEFIDLGGGYGVRYSDESALNFENLVSEISTLVDDPTLELGFEPGRSLVANAGLLLTRVEYLKYAPSVEYRNFAIVDAGMSELIRPPLYDAYHRIEPVITRQIEHGPVHWDVVGPVCESTDYLGKNRSLSIEENDLLVVLGAGAYGRELGSNYNSRPRCAEVLIDSEGAHLIRRRDGFVDLIRNERIV